MLDQAYDYNQLMIAERIKNLEARQMMLRRQLEKDIKAFNRAFVNKMIYPNTIIFLFNRLIKNDVNVLSKKHLNLKIKNKRFKICSSIIYLQKVEIIKNNARILQS
jgi:hypothetical protein